MIQTPSHPVDGALTAEAAKAQVEVPDIFLLAEMIDPNHQGGIKPTPQGFQPDDLLHVLSTRTDPTIPCIKWIWYDPYNFKLVMSHFKTVSCAETSQNYEASKSTKNEK